MRLVAGKRRLCVEASIPYDLLSHNPRSRVDRERQVYNASIRSRATEGKRPVLISRRPWPHNRRSTCGLLNSWSCPWQHMDRLGISMTTSAEGLRKLSTSSLTSRQFWLMTWPSSREVFRYCRIQGARESELRSHR